MLVFASLKSLIPKVGGTVTDNWVFRLHCRVTIIFLIAFTILATSREYIGDPIECAHDTDKPPTSVINQFCWITSTFSFPDLFDAEVGKDVIYPGVGPNYRTRGKKEPVVYHKYYQWVVFMLCLQAILFYIPRYLWKIWEGEKIKMLIQNLNQPLLDEETKTKQIDQLSTYFVENLREHNSYAFKYAFCECLNMVNVVGQIFMLDRFLGGEFSQYGFQVLMFINEDQPSRVDPMIKVFPRLTKCTYYYYGFSGEIQNKEAICVLPLNIINEKIYVFMWLWFCILTVITFVALVYRFCVMVFPGLRVLVVHSRSAVVPISRLQMIVSKLMVGDWFILYQLSKNMDPNNFSDFMKILNAKLEYHTSENDNKQNAYNYNEQFATMGI